MRREPSIHITKENLKAVLFSLYGGDDPDGIDNMVDQIFHTAKPYSLNSRTISISNDKMEKKAQKLLSSSRLDSDLLAQLIYSTRKRSKHRGISRIAPGSKEWLTLKGITANALDFCNEFEYTRRYGFLKYIETGVSMMQKFMLNKFVNLYEPICERHQAVVEIEADNDSETTREMYGHYTRNIIENTGIMDNLDELPEKFVWFVRARAQAEKMNISVKIYIKAQFAGLDFSKGIPHPVQLVGPKATDRVVRYCYKNEIKTKS